MRGDNKPIIYSPVRANLLGGWTDQEKWPEMAAVSNVAIGWTGTYRGQYPLMMDRRGVLRSKVKGYGSGLGISSILLALREIHTKQEMLKGDLTSVILKVLEEVGSRLQIEIRPFQQTRRQALIDLLTYDAKVQEAAAAHAVSEGRHFRGKLVFKVR